MKIKNFVIVETETDSDGVFRVINKLQPMDETKTELATITAKEIQL